MNKIYNIIVRRSIFQITRSLCSSNYQIRLYHHFNRDISTNNNLIQDGLNLSIIKRFKHKRKNPVKVIRTIFTYIFIRYFNQQLQKLFFIVY